MCRLNGAIVRHGGGEEMVHEGVWEEEEEVEEECSYTKATPGCGRRRAVDEGRMDSST